MPRNVFSFSLAASVLISTALSPAALSAEEEKKASFEPTMEMVSHLSCEEVWIGVAEQEEAFFQVVELFAHHILNAREVTFPDSAEVGKSFGQAVVKNCLDDPEELLYSAVNRGLRDTLPPQG
jgi:hypothetical protein